MDAEERAVLRFDGIDTLADVFLNGEKIGETSSIAVPYEFDVTSCFKTNGENTVQVLLRSVRIARERREPDARLIRKAPHMGGWDILPRAFVAGLWRSVSFEIRSPFAVKDTEWRVEALDVAQRTATVSVRATGVGRFGFLGNGMWHMTLLRNGRTVAKHDAKAGSWREEVRWNLENVDFWWPRAMGEPALYELVTELIDASGGVLASKREKVGIRTIRLLREDVYEDDPNRRGQFLFVVNGEPCYVRGTNWVPLDAMHGRDGRHLAAACGMLADLNCNMVRMWGGGVYEPDAFFDWCDANGVMVWQDFMDANCGHDEDYADVIRHEATQLVKRLRNHASLALWCGNNELDLSQWRWKRNGGVPVDPNVNDRTTREILPGAIFANDTMHDFLPSSPYLGPAVTSGLARESERHVWGRKYYKSGDYTKTRAWFMSETGFHGCPNLDSLRRMMQPSCVYPWTDIPGGRKDRTWNLDWQMKAVNASLDASKKGAWDRNNVMVRQVEYVFGEASTNLADFVWQSQFAQAEALKYITELFRSWKFDRFNGLLWWNLRDGWPVVSDSVVDYWNGEKMAYGFLKTVQRDAIVLVTDDHKLWAVNDRRASVKGCVTVRDAVSGRKILHVPSFVIPANGKAVIGEVQFEGQGLLLIEATLSDEPYRSHYLYGKPPFDFAKVRKWFGGLVK